MNYVTGSASHQLVCHPRTPSQVIDGIDVLVGAAPGDNLRLVYGLVGDLARLRIPEPGPSRRADGLWAHTCFEVFVMPEGGAGYREFNFAPTGEWAVYAFRGYREGGEMATELAPEIKVRRSGDRLELDVKICHDFLPRGSQLRLGLSAVVEDTGGELSYWALRHAAGKPDFHHRDAFVLPLELQ